MTTQPDPQQVPELLEQCARAIFQLGYINWERSEEYARACLAAMPDTGWVLVPVEPTEEMLAAYFDALVYPVTERSRPWHRVKAIKRWKAMLAALPAMVKEKD